MKIIMMGTGPFAVPTFESLAIKHEIPLLVTRPSIPVKRGKQPPTPMKDAAVKLGIPVVEPVSVNDDEFVQELADHQSDLFVVCDYGQILSKKCLAASRLGGINLHGSLLPKYRGAAPVNWPIYFGDTVTGISVIHMTPRLDGGPVLSSQSTEIGSEETAEQLEPRLSEMGVPCVHDAIEQLEKWDGTSTIGAVQDSSLATPARRLKKSDGAIDWSRTAFEIKNQIRAFQPWPASFTNWQREPNKAVRLIVHQVQVVPEATSSPVGGTVIATDDDSGSDSKPRRKLWVATGSGAVAIESIQPAGKRQMDIQEFLRGYPVKVGDRLVMTN